VRCSNFLLYIAFCGLITSAAGDIKGDFSGIWTMDPARSESAHQDTPGGASTLVISVTEGSLNLETTWSDGNNPRAFHEILNLKLDGSETVGQSDSGNSVTGKARRDGAKLVVETSRNIQDSTVTTMDVYVLSKDGREMTIDKTLTVQHGYQGVNAALTTGHAKDVFIRGAK
jgi:hypothetical protein